MKSGVGASAGASVGGAGRKRRESAAPEVCGHDAANGAAGGNGTAADAATVSGTADAATHTEKVLSESSASVCGGGCARSNPVGVGAKEAGVHKASGAEHAEELAVALAVQYAGGEDGPVGAEEPTVIVAEDAASVLDAGYAEGAVHAAGAADVGAGGAAPGDTSCSADIAAASLEDTSDKAPKAAEGHNEAGTEHLLCPRAAVHPSVVVLSYRHR